MEPWWRDDSGEQPCLRNYPVSMPGSDQFFNFAALKITNSRDITFSITTKSAVFLYSLFWL